MPSIFSNTALLRNPDGSRVFCRHCRQNPVGRPRGLCWSCYHQPGVKELYPPTSKFARRSPVVDFHHDSPPCQPTHALPGTLEKVAVLEGRAARGQELFHPDDAVAPPRGYAAVVTSGGRAGRRAGYR